MPASCDITLLSVAASLHTAYLLPPMSLIYVLLLLLFSSAILIEMKGFRYSREGHLTTCDWLNADGVFVPTEFVWSVHLFSRFTKGENSKSCGGGRNKFDNCRDVTPLMGRGKCRIQPQFQFGRLAPIDEMNLNAWRLLIFILFVDTEVKRHPQSASCKWIVESNAFLHCTSAQPFNQKPHSLLQF